MYSVWLPGAGENKRFNKDQVLLRWGQGKLVTNTPGFKWEPSPKTEVWCNGSRLSTAKALSQLNCSGLYGCKAITGNPKAYVMEKSDASISFQTEAQPDMKRIGAAATGLRTAGFLWEVKKDSKGCLIPAAVVLAQLKQVTVPAHSSVTLD